MNGTILVAVDHLGSAKRTADMAAEIASGSGNLVTVVHVHQVATGKWGRIVVEDEPAEDCVADLVAKELQSAGVKADYKTIEAPMGRVGAAIAVAADRLDAALIVMGTHGESDLESMTLGSTSHRVIHRSRRPLLLVPSD
jgi:nucleotide-binding universal stress UspA family protein